MNTAGRRPAAGGVPAASFAAPCGGKGAAR